MLALRARTGRSTGRAAARWVVTLVVLGALVAVLARHGELHRFVSALRGADWRLVAAAGVVSVTLAVGASMMRLRPLLGPLPRRGGGIGLWELTRLYLTSCAFQNLAPAPAADVVRTVQLQRRHGYALQPLIGAVLVEKVIEALGLGLETLVVAAAGRLPGALGLSLYSFAFLGAGGALAVLIVARRFGRRPAQSEAPPAVGAGPAGAGRVRAPRDRLWAWLLRSLECLAEGMRLVLRPRICAEALLFSCLSDVANAVTVGLSLLAVGIHLPVSAWFVLALVTRLASLIPATPGQVGVLEAGMVLALGWLGVDHSQALVVALLYHGAHWIPVTAVGLLWVRQLV